MTEPTTKLEMLYTNAMTLALTLLVVLTDSSWACKAMCYYGEYR